jgi:hypothetical protein
VIFLSLSESNRSDWTPQQTAKQRGAFPITVLDRQNQRQQTVAAVSMSVNLPHHFKGTHMSRFLEILSRHQGEVTMRTLPELLHDLKNHLESKAAHIEVEFPYFLTRAAPVTGAQAPMDCCLPRPTAGATSPSFTLPGVACRKPARPSGFAPASTLTAGPMSQKWPAPASAPSLITTLAAASL